jgi:3-oxoacyl-[acyl-carrier protein] reductase
MGRLEDRVALITGASSGIGAGVALAFASEGACVAINHPGETEREAAEAVAEAARSRGVEAIVVQADVSSEAQVAAMMDQVEGAFARVDILVNNAGFATRGPVETLPLHRWERMLAVHLTGTFLCTRAVLPGMYERDFGRIINTASQLAYRGGAERSHYVAAKAGIIGFTRSLALEIGPRGVTANCVAPGATETPILDGASTEFLDALRATIPKGRFATVDEIVPAYVYLASDDARHMMGQTISPNGGDVFL